MAENTTKFRIILIIVVLAITAGISQAIIYRQSVSFKNHVERPRLQQYFTNLPDWRGRNIIPLTDDIIQTLRLDDYIYRSFGSSDLPISLYIGFYHTAGKIGASHDPLVCFQGQGWQIVDRGKGYHKITGAVNQQINYATLIAQRDTQHELIIYWFQTHDKTANNTFKQKYDMALQRFKGGGVENAFIRISAPLTEDTSKELVMEQMFDFIDIFYPKFLTYLSIN
jgi:EpsI family protein